MVRDDAAGDSLEKMSSDVGSACAQFSDVMERLAENIGREIARHMFRDLENRRLTWRERLRPRWRIFQWLHDIWYGYATFVCGERLNLHRGAGLEDWVAGVFEREE